MALGRFWSRRLRRLFPAAALTLVGVAAGSRVAGALATEGLAGDLLASLAQVANWRFVLADQSYGDLFAAPSPVLHFWSLAIEEQFYWLFPLVTAGRWPWSGSLRVYAAALAALVAAAAAWRSTVTAGRPPTTLPTSGWPRCPGAARGAATAGAAPTRRRPRASPVPAPVRLAWWPDHRSPRWPGHLVAYAVA